MIINKKEFLFRSSSDLCDIFACSYFPDKNVELKGVVQIAHGMAEHHERYEDFIEFLNKNGYAVYINDHLGHGKSVANDKQLGYFGEKDGYLNLVKDMKKLTKIISKECPDLPVILFGHSMGSMLARIYTEKYGKNLKAAVYCGTCGSNPAAKPGIAIVKTIAKIKGDHYRSEFINKLAFGSYNKKFTPQRTAFDWLTTDNDIVDKYINDPYCGFLFTTYGYRDLMSMIVEINRSDWYTSVPLDLPIYLIAGEDDPVGNYGKGIKEVYGGLVDTNHTDVSIKLFSGARHEILNEKNKEEVYKNILSWLNTVIE
ncbi:MAG: alpha/beta hydrolase [Clostridia bacterium]|nr:alpha/beta hydrolase [Clostridia bacterium]